MSVFDLLIDQDQVVGVLKDAVNFKTTISTGGFHAEYDKNKGSSFLTLSFYVDSIQTEI